MSKKTLTILGGGRGLSIVLEGVKNFKNLNIIVGVADSGGSTGKLRKTFNCPAMGDIRRCVSMLGDTKLKSFLEYRIPKYKDCVGNLIIASLTKLYSFEVAIKVYQKLAKASPKHNIIPVSLDNFNIQAEYKNGTITKKETEFNKEEKINKVWLSPIPKPNSIAIKAIKNSEWIIISPGSFYTSIISNLLVPGISDEINKKKIIWIANLMQQKGETVDMFLQEHYNNLIKYIKHIDVAIINIENPDKEFLKKNYKDYLMPLLHFEDKNVPTIIEDKLIKYKNTTIIHNSGKVYNIIKNLI